MKRITFQQPVNIKWLTRELQAAGVTVASVGLGDGVPYAEIAETDETAALTVIATHDPGVTPDILERQDLVGLEGEIANELTWINTAISEIDTGLGVIDGATLAQLKAIVRGVLQNQRRILLEQQRELKAWRYVVRRLK